MTTLKPLSPVIRETDSLYRGRPLCIALYPGYVEVWPKATRQRAQIGLGAVYEAALKIKARLDREARPGQQKPRKRRSVMLTGKGR